MLEYCSDANFTHEKIHELIYSPKKKETKKKYKKTLKRTQFDSENYCKYKLANDKEDGLPD